VHTEFMLQFFVDLLFGEGRGVTERLEGDFHFPNWDSLRWQRSQGVFPHSECQALTAQWAQAKR